jgi:phosphotransferase system HPr-like phosphotransfer protein
LIKREIILKSIENVKEFVNIAMNHDFDIELVSGKYTVNAKSIMGIFSLDLTKPLIMVAHCEEDDSLISEIESHLFVLAH